MAGFLRRHLSTMLVAFITAAVTAAGPAIAATIADYARNSDKVDGKHAVGAGASPASRSGKLVATGSNGRLPNNIIARAPDAELIDGLDSSVFMPASKLSTTTNFLLYSSGAPVSLTALCALGDAVVGGWAQGVGIDVTSEGRHRVHGQFGVGEQGWQVTGTATNDGGNHFITVGAVCLDI